MCFSCYFWLRVRVFSEEKVNFATVSGTGLDSEEAAGRRQGISNWDKYKPVSEPRIVQHNTKLTFLDSKKTLIKAIPLINSVGHRTILVNNRTSQVDESELNLAEVSGDGERAVIVTCIGSVSAEKVGEISNTIKYYNSNGDLLWEKDNYALKDMPLHTLSFDGKRIFLLTKKRVTVDFTEKYVYNAEICDDTGKTIQQLGEFSDVYDYKITQNGKYGCFRYEKGSETGAMFFDVDKTSSNVSAEPGYADITESGKASVSIVLASMFTHGVGKVTFYGMSGEKEFESDGDKMTPVQQEMFRIKEFEKVTTNTGLMKEDHVLRTRNIYEYQFD